MKEIEEIKTIEDFITKLKSLEVSSHVWLWETKNAAEIAAIKEFYLELHEAMDNFIIICISDMGWKDSGFMLDNFKYKKFDDLELMGVIQEIKDFITYRIMKVSNYSPEYVHSLTKIIHILHKFNYKMLLE